MSQDQITLPEPTTDGATRETEPEVQAGILSGDIGPNVPLMITDDDTGLSWGRLALLLAGSIALGYGASRYWRR